MKEFEFLSDEKIEYLLNAGMESESLDYKRELDIRSQPSMVKLAKDIAAMANSGGGYIVIGVDNNFNKIGMDHSQKIDEADLRSKVNKYFEPKIEFYYREVTKIIDNAIKKFGIIYVKASEEIVLAKTAGNYQEKGRTKTEFGQGAILVRDGSKSKPANYYELRQLLEKAIVKGRIESQQKASSINKILENLGKPDRVKELLIGNIFKVIKMSQYIWSAPTSFIDKRSV